MDRNQQFSPLLPLLLAISAVLVAALAILLLRGDAAGWEWIVVLGLAGAFLLFAVALPLANCAELYHPRVPRGAAMAQLAVGLLLFLVFLLRFPTSSAAGSEIATIADVALGLVGGALAFHALYPAR